MNTFGSFPCPRCGHEQTCPCNACQERKPTKKPWKWVDGQFIECGNCGLLGHCDWWMDVEYAHYEKKKGEDKNDSEHGHYYLQSD